MPDEHAPDQNSGSNVVVFNAVPAAVTFGIIAGLVLSGATAWLILKGGDEIGPHLSLLGQYFIGYSVSWGGVVIGFFYAFATAFSCIYLIAKIYNWVIRIKY